jgi:hypothetical protein
VKEVRDRKLMPIDIILLAKVKKLGIIQTTLSILLQSVSQEE